MKADAKSIDELINELETKLHSMEAKWDSTEAKVHAIVAERLKKKLDSAKAELTQWKNDEVASITSLCNICSVWLIIISCYP